MTGSATNITDAQRSAFEALASGAFANFDKNLNICK